MRFLINKSILLLFIMAIGFSIHGYAQKCGNFETTLSITDSPCQSNGAILISVTGQDVTPGDNGEPAPLNNLQYCAVLAGVTPKESDWRNTNDIRGLAPGTYDVYVRGTCLYDDNKLTVHTVSTTAKVNQLNGWAPLQLNATVVSASLQCKPTGTIRLSNFRGGLPPYSLEIVEYPASYTGPTKLYDNVSALPTGTVLIENLPAGSYRIVATEGSTCASTLDMPSIIVADAGGNFPTSWFNSYYDPAQYAVYQSLGASAVGDDSQYCNSLGLRRTTLDNNNPYQYFLNNWEKYYEYAIYYQGDDISDPDAFEWTDFPTLSSMYFKIDDLKYTVSEMQADKTNKTPKFLARVKGCTAFAPIPSPSVSNVSALMNLTFSDCGDATLNLYTWGDYDGLLCYPYTWRIMKVDGGVETLYQQSTAPAPWQYSTYNRWYFSNVPAGTYKVYITDAGGYELTASRVVSPSSPAETMVSQIGYVRCESAYLPALYLSPTSYGGLANIKSIEYVKTQKYVGNTWVDDLTFPAPPLLKLDMDNVPADSLVKYDSYVTLWANTEKDAVVPSLPSLTNSAYSNLYLIESKTQWIDPGDDHYQHIVLVEDRCNPGVKVAKTITGYNNRYDHVATPDIQLERSCTDNSFEFKIPNISNLIKWYDRSTGQYRNHGAYISVASYPSGAGVTYSSGSYYIASPSDWIRASKPGKYVFVVSPTSSGVAYSSQEALDTYCSYLYEVIVPEIPQFEMDTDGSAAYRCPGSGVGGGLGRIEVKVKSGMGPYVFELFAGDDTNRENALQTNTDGLFQDWNATNSDEYWIVGSDYGCPGKVESFEQLINVYDLSNGVRISTEGNRLCIGSDIVLRSLALGETTYEWEYIKPAGSSSTFVWSGDKRDEQIDDATLEMNGSYKVTVAIPGCTGSPKISGSVDISVGEKLLYWNPKGQDGNWFNANNWLRHDGQVSEYTPAGCTTVHISGLADYYPNLHNDYSPWGAYGYPSCDSIIYHYGGETAYPSFLQYNRAFVQYNFGMYNDLISYYDPEVDGINAAPVSRDTYGGNEYPTLGISDQVPSISRAYWAMVSAPLKGIVGGDFGVCGRPYIYQRAFNMTSPENGKPSVNVFTDAFSKMNIPTSNTYNSIALWAADYNYWGGILGALDQSNLEGLGGVIELPYYENSEEMSYRPLYRYNKDTSTSSFYYFRLSDLEEDPFVAPDVYVRPSDSYRFVTEGSNNEPEKILVGSEWVSVYRQPLNAVGAGFGSSIMIGNPLMCHIDFDKFYTLNSSIIEPEYSVIDYKEGDELVYQQGNPLSDLTKDIAPLQGFIVKRKNPQSSEELIYHLDGLNSVVSYGSGNAAQAKPRSTSAVNDVTGYITVSTSAQWQGESFGSSTSIMYNLGNSSESGYTPDYLDRRAFIFFLGDDNVTTYRYKREGDPMPVVMKLSTITENKGDIVMNIQSEANDLIEKLILRDKYLNIEQDVTAGGSYTYKHRVNQSQLGVLGLDNTRFELEATYKTSVGLESDSEDTFLSVTCSDNRLHVSSSGLISDIRLSNVSGLLVLSDTGIDSMSYNRDLVLVPGTYLVQVVLSDGSIESRKIIVK